MILIKYLYIFCSLTVLVGCYDKKELEEKSYVVAIGLDKAEEKGKIQVTFQITNPEVGNQITGGGSQEKPKETVTLTANDFISAQNTANAFVARELSLDHTKVIIISEKLARSKQLLNVIQTATRAQQLRRETSLIISKESASQFLNENEPLLETRPHKYYQFMIDRAKETGIIPKSDIHRFFQITEGDADLFLAMYATSEVDKEGEKNGHEDEYLAGQIEQQGGNSTQFMGSAVFKEGQMIGTLTGEETRFALLFDNTIHMEDLLVTYPDPKAPEYRIAGRVTKKKDTEVDVLYEKDRQTMINVKIPLDIEILAVPSLVNYSQNKQSREFLKQEIEKNLEEKAQQLINKTQEEYKAEPFYWSLYIRKYFSTIKQYEKADWNKKIYPQADVNVDFVIEVVQFGKQLKESNLSEIRD